MQIAIPDVNKTLNTLMAVRSTFEDRTQSISDWVMEHRNEMKKNQLLLAVKSPANDIAILNIFLPHRTFVWVDTTSCGKLQTELHILNRPYIYTLRREPKQVPRHEGPDWAVRRRTPSEAR